jgi:hypothetical protein
MKKDSIEQGVRALQWFFGWAGRDAINKFERINDYLNDDYEEPPPP